MIPAFIGNGWNWKQILNVLFGVSMELEYEIPHLSESWNVNLDEIHDSQNGN
jgi:hypothetical protein